MNTENGRVPVPVEELHCPDCRAFVCETNATKFRAVCPGRGCHSMIYMVVRGGVRDITTVDKRRLRDVR